MNVAVPLRRAWHLLPQGQSLPEDSWRQRHTAILALLALHVPGIIIFGLFAGERWIHCLEESLPVAGLALLAALPLLDRQIRALLASLGLMVSSATLVHLSGGQIEMHFHYFVMVIVISLYQNWMPFLASLAFVVGQHGVMGVIDPHSVYNHSDGLAHPWRWAAVHGTFILAASAASLANWRLNENVRSRVELLLDSTAEGIAGIDLSGRVTFVNEAAAKMLGRTPEEMLRQPIHEVVHAGREDGPGHCMEDCWVQAPSAPGVASAGGEDTFWTKDGVQVPIEFTPMPIRDRGRLIGAVLSFRDITLRKRHEAQLEYQAHFDALTGLANRRLLADQLAHSLPRASSRAQLSGILIIDLDRFKIINDSLGHSAGDALLIEVGRRIDAAVRPEDTVARLGGDEFAVLLPTLGDEHIAFDLADRILASVASPFLLHDHEVVTAASIGIALSQPDDPYLRPEDLVRDGDVAMYRAKSLGGGQAVSFESSMSIVQTERWELENDLRRAVENNELRLYYQPEVLLSTGEIVGMEALVRWEHPRLGLLEPSRFIPIAEESHLILEIGRWVLNEACRQLREWQDGYPESDSLTMSVNLSMRELRQSNLVEQVATVLATHQISPRGLRLEVTESVMMQDPTSTIATLHGLKTLGVRLAIDDFGTGYSSLSHLQRFPVETLKVDRSFVVAMEHDEGTRSIISAVMALSKALGLEVTAEGIETETQLAGITALACDRGQGYYFSRPIPAASMTATLARSSEQDGSSGERHAA